MRNILPLIRHASRLLPRILALLDRFLILRLHTAVLGCDGNEGVGKGGEDGTDVAVGEGGVADLGFEGVELDGVLSGNTSASWQI